MSKMKNARCCAKVCLKRSRVLGRHDAMRIQVAAGPRKVFVDKKQKPVFEIGAAKGTMHLECFQAQVEREEKMK